MTDATVPIVPIVPTADFDVLKIPVQRIDVDKYLPHDLEQVVALAIANAASCWERPGDAGEFQSGLARGLALNLIQWVNEHYVLRDVERDGKHPPPTGPVAIICLHCRKREALPLNFTGAPNLSNVWRCEACGHQFENGLHV